MIATKHHEIKARLVIRAETKEEAEEIAAKRLRLWMNESLSHNRSLGFIPGNLVYWDLIEKQKVKIGG